MANDTAKKIMVTDSDQGDLVITRVFNAPREDLWKYWTEPVSFMRWWGPLHFTTPYSEIDFRVGGKYLNCMESPDGRKYWSRGVYTEIVAPEKITATDSFSDETGGIVPASEYGMTGGLPDEFMMTMMFRDDGGRTIFTLIHSGLPEGEGKEMARQGWNESFDKLDECLAREKIRSRRSA